MKKKILNLTVAEVIAMCGDVQVVCKKCKLYDKERAACIFKDFPAFYYKMEKEAEGEKKANLRKINDTLHLLLTNIINSADRGDNDGEQQAREDWNTYMQKLRNGEIPISPTDNVEE
jgi:hypothetical protein